MNEGVWKSFGLASTTLNHRGGKQFSFPLPKGWKIVYCYLSFEITTEGAL